MKQQMVITVGFSTVNITEECVPLGKGRLGGTNLVLAQLCNPLGWMDDVFERPPTVFPVTSDCDLQQGLT